MKQDNVRERRVRDFKEFKAVGDNYQKGGDSNRTISEEDHEKVHPGYHKIKGEPLFTKHDSNIYHAYGIEVDEDYDETNNFVKARLKNPKMMSDEEMENASKRKKGYDEEGYTEMSESKDNKKENKKYDEESEEGYYHAAAGGPGDTSSDGVSENEKQEKMADKKTFESFGRIYSFKGFVISEAEKMDYEDEDEDEEEMEYDEEEMEESEKVEEDETEEVSEDEEMEYEEEEEEEESVDESLGKKGHPIKDDSQLKKAKVAKGKQNLSEEAKKGEGKGKHPIKDDSQLKKAKVAKGKQNLSEEVKKGEGKGKHPIKNDSQLKKAKVSKDKQNLSEKY